MWDRRLEELCDGGGAARSSYLQASQSSLLGFSLGAYIISCKEVFPKLALKEHVFQLEAEELNGGGGVMEDPGEPRQSTLSPSTGGLLLQGERCAPHPKALTSVGARRVHPGDSRAGSCSCRN